MRHHRPIAHLPRIAGIIEEFSIPLSGHVGEIDPAHRIPETLDGRTTMEVIPNTIAAAKSRRKCAENAAQLILGEEAVETLVEEAIDQLGDHFR